MNDSDYKLLKWGMIIRTDFYESVYQFLENVGLTGDIQLNVLPCGGNNRVFQVRCDDKIFFLKSYFSHPNDPRDRLKTEYLFSQFLWKRNIHVIPEPIAQEQEQRWGLYEFIQGHSLSTNEVRQNQVNEAATFFIDINNSLFTSCGLIV